MRRQSGPILCPKSQQLAIEVLVIPNSKACLPVLRAPNFSEALSSGLQKLHHQKHSHRRLVLDIKWPTCSLGLGPCSCSLLGGRAEANPLFLNPACQGMAADMEL